MADDHSFSDLADSIGTTAVTFALSELVQTLLGVYTDSVKDLYSQSLSINLSKVIKASETIWQSEACCRYAVIKCSLDIVLKIVPDPEDYTEYTSMQYLAQNAAHATIRKTGVSILSSFHWNSKLRNPARGPTAKSCSTEDIILKAPSASARATK